MAEQIVDDDGDSTFYDDDGALLFVDDAGNFTLESDTVPVGPAIGRLKIRLRK